MTFAISPFALSLCFVSFFISRTGEDNHRCKDADKADDIRDRKSGMQPQKGNDRCGDRFQGSDQKRLVRTDYADPPFKKQRNAMVVPIRIMRISTKIPFLSRGT